jgi:hypothetical protein
MELYTNTKENELVKKFESPHLNEQFGAKGHIGFTSFKTRVGLANIETSPDLYHIS